MSRGAIGRHGAAILGYAAVALLFTWPLPLHLGDALLGSPAGDLGVYLWNVWVFRHEIVAHHHLPFSTHEILALASRTPLVLQNYTVAADVVAFPFLPFAGLVATFNVITLASGVLAAYAMFLFARARTTDAAAAWVAGLVFGFSAFMSMRATEHLSLIQATPLPLFGWLMLRMARGPTWRLSTLGGLIVAWAFLSDPYYAVYCLLMLAFTVGYSVFTVSVHPEPARRRWRFRVLDALLIAAGAVIAGIAITGGGRLELLGLRIGLRGLYTPVLVFTVVAAARLVLTFRPKVTWTVPSWRTLLMPLPGVVILLLVLIPMMPSVSLSRSMISTPGGVLWRSSPPGLDVASYLLPNPLHPWLGALSADWLGHQPNGLTENVASLPWVAMIIIGGVAVWRRRMPDAIWLAFTGLAVWLSLGPFIRIAGMSTYVPTPWTLLRYLPVVGAARMPPRFAILALLGVAMLLAMALRSWRSTARRPGLITAGVAGLLVLEMLPAPRALYPAHIPDILQVVAEDPRDARVLNLPFGLRDGLGSAGDNSSEYQFHQTLHHKALIGGYLSRLPANAVEQYRQLPVMGTLLDLSEGRPVPDDQVAAAIVAARERAAQLRIGWVVVDTRYASPALVAFSRKAFDLDFVSRDGHWDLYRAPFSTAP